MPIEEETLEIYIKDGRNDVLSTLTQIPAGTFQCRDEIIALLRGNCAGRYMVNLIRKRKFFSRKLYEYGVVRDNTGGLVYETKRIISEKKNECRRPDTKSDP